MRTIAQTLAGTMRLPFLLLTPACVLLGIAATVWAGHVVDPGRAALVMLGALAAHASVNMFNEWHDFRSGLDATTQRTPFSGGSGALPAHPAALQATLLAATLALAVSAGIGIWLLMQPGGTALLPIGLAGIVLVLAYTPWITRHPLLCLLAPGLGFGPLMVGGTQVALSGQHQLSTYAAALVPWALVSGLLLLNQFPDVEADRAVGRRHLPMTLGRPRAARVFMALLAVAQLSALLGVATRLFPPQALLALLTLPLAFAVGRGALQHAQDTAALLPTMGRNVALTLLMPLLLTLGLWWGAA